MKDLISTLECYGADPSNLHIFDADAPSLLPYATLVSARRSTEDLKALVGVYEWQSNPLIFIVDGAQIQEEGRFKRIRRCLALRGDGPYLAVVYPGRLSIHRVGLDSDGQNACQLKGLPLEESRTTLPFLGNFRPKIASPRKWISSIILTLLRDAIRELLQHRLTENDAISLTGRALFLRFLGDRALLPATLGPAECIFNDIATAESASRWLDNTFNGDFLPLSPGLFRSLPDPALRPLGDILFRAPEGQLHLGWQEKWNYLDFAHIPVGVLSETYEHYMREHAREKQRKEGSFYTPRIIADLMVNASFQALRSEGKARKAVVLDPAAGAGVFLVAAFRQLVMERWISDNKRPDTAILREILYNQIAGFDINEQALRFAALALYLMSIELDPEPEPVEKLRFTKNLRGIVLHDFGNGPNPSADSLGSLGKAVGSEHLGRYHLVIGNPPWSSSTGLEGWPEVSGMVTDIARKRLPAGSFSSLLPNEVLDLPFVWRSMEWAKPGGQISFALHARVLFQIADGMFEARSALFRAMDVTGIVNGSELRQTRVWPEISAPFCLIFAKNEIPSPEAAFRFVTPHLEEGLNSAGVMRIDTANAELVSPTEVAARPELLKALFRGTALDVELCERMRRRGVVTLEQYWRTSFGERNGRPRQTGNGYQRLRASSRIRKYGDGKPGVSAAYLWDLREVTAAAIEGLEVDRSKLADFTRERIHDPRPRSLFEGPLLIVHKSPPAGAERIRSSVSDSDVVFNQSYYGYSARNHEDALRLLRYLALLIGSKIALWYVLLTSGEFGFERETIEKITIDHIPIIPFDSLTPFDLQHIDLLFNAVVHNDTDENWSEVDRWAASLYGLETEDLQIIYDTLRLSLPFAHSRRAAQLPPTSNEIAAFCEIVTSELGPWAKREGMWIEVRPSSPVNNSPWSLLEITGVAGNGSRPGGCAPIKDWHKLLQLADAFASTEVILPDLATKSLRIARLNQARYWSRSQGRLLARRIIWEDLETLFGSELE